MKNFNNKTFSDQAGIAIGPILFVVAILAVLVGALAAGSGGFGSSTANDANRTNASTLIEQGTNIKTASDRLLVNGYLPTDEYLSQTYSATPAASLFSPTGGGLTAQNPTTNTVASGATWTYTQVANLPGVGSAGANDVATYIQVYNQTMCQAINSVIFGSTSPQASIANVTSTGTVVYNTLASTCSDSQLTTSTTGCNLSANTFPISDLSSSTTGMGGRVQGCIKDATGKFYYYQLLSAG